MSTYYDIAARSRIDVNDTAVPYRVDDATYLGFVKDGIKEMVPFRPDLFKVDGFITCTVGQMEQILPNAPRSVALIDIYTSTYGASTLAMYECDIETLRRFKSTWRTDTAAQAEDWMRYPMRKGKRDDRRFMVYPKAPVGQTLAGCWSEVPDMSAVTTSNWTAQTLPVTDELFGALSKYVMYRVENLNEESAVKARAEGYKAEFLQIMGAAAAQKDD